MSVLPNRPRLLACCVSVALGFSVLPAQAIDSHWVSGSGDWDGAANWDTGAVPYMENVFIQSSDGIDRAVTYNSATPPGYLDSLVLDATAGGSIEFNQVGSYLNGDRYRVGVLGSASVTQSDGSALFGALTVGELSGSTGRYQFSGGDLNAWNLSLGESAGSQGTFTWTGGLLNTTNLQIGQGGNGTFIQDIGSGPGYVVPLQSVRVGEQLGSVGTYELLSGEVRYDDQMLVGIEGHGIVRQTGGRNQVRFLRLGEMASGSGRYQLDGITSDLSTVQTVVGASGLGEFIQNDGLHYSYNDVVVGDLGNGIYQLNNGQLIARRIVLGQGADGVGVLEQTGGYIQASQMVVGGDGYGRLIYNPGPAPEYCCSYSLIVGENAGSVGVFEQHSGLRDMFGVTVHVGYAGSGEYRQFAGEHYAYEIYIGNQVGSDGHYELSETTPGVPSVLRTGSTKVGNWGAGGFVQTGGMHESTSLRLGDQAGSKGIYRLSGPVSSMLFTGNTRVGMQGEGEFYQTGGIHTSEHLFIGDWYGSKGSYNLSGGQLQTNNTWIGGGDHIGVMTVDGPDTRWHNQNQIHVGDALFSAPELAGGVLQLLNGAQINTAGVIIGETGRLEGNGVVFGDVSNGGLVTPGLSAGQLDIFGNYTQTADGTLAMEIGGHGYGFDQDFINIFGDAELGGTLSVSLLGGYNPYLGEIFDIMYASLISGSFDELLFPIFNGMTFDIAYDANLIRLTVVNAVPVPAAAWLFGSGVLALAGVARRRKAA